MTYHALDFYSFGKIGDSFTGVRDASKRQTEISANLINGGIYSVTNPKAALQSAKVGVQTVWYNNFTRPYADGNYQKLANNATLTGLNIASVFYGGLGTATGKVGAIEKLDGSLIRYGPMNPGPLSPAKVQTFRSGTYQKVVTQEPETFYRVYGDGVKQLGGFWTQTKPTGPVQSIIDSALDRTWDNPNPATQVVTIKVPAGTTYFKGIAAPQGGLVGGGSQVLFPEHFNIDSAWIIGK